MHDCESAAFKKFHVFIVLHMRIFLILAFHTKLIKKAKTNKNSVKTKHFQALEANWNWTELKTKSKNEIKMKNLLETSTL